MEAVADNEVPRRWATREINGRAVVIVFAVGASISALQWEARGWCACASRAVAVAVAVRAVSREMRVGCPRPRACCAYVRTIELRGDEDVVSPTVA